MCLRPKEKDELSKETGYSVSKMPTISTGLHTWWPELVYFAMQNDTNVVSSSNIENDL